MDHKGREDGDTRGLVEIQRGSSHYNAINRKAIPVPDLNGVAVDPATLRPTCWPSYQRLGTFPAARDSYTPTI